MCLFLFSCKSLNCSFWQLQWKYIFTLVIINYHFSYKIYDKIRYLHCPPSLLYLIPSPPIDQRSPFAKTYFKLIYTHDVNSVYHSLNLYKLQFVFLQFGFMTFLSCTSVYFRLLWQHSLTLTFASDFVGVFGSLCKELVFLPNGIIDNTTILFLFLFVMEYQRRKSEPWRRVDWLDIVDGWLVGS